VQLSAAEQCAVAAGNGPDDLNSEPIFVLIISDLLIFIYVFLTCKYLEAQLPSFLSVSGVFEDG
jgi:hypothetical protein